MLEARHWDRNKKDIIKHQPENWVLLFTADTYFQITNTAKSHVLNTLRWGATITESLPSGSLHTNRYQTDKWHQLPPLFSFFFSFFCREVFMWWWWYWEGRFYTSLSLNRKKPPGRVKLKTGIIGQKQGPAGPDPRRQVYERAPWWPVQEQQTIKTAEKEGVVQQQEWDIFLSRVSLAKTLWLRSQTNWEPPPIAN